LLKLAELRGTATPAQQARWKQIKADFLRNKAMGADDADIGGRMVAQLADIAGNLQSLRPEPAERQAPVAQWAQLVEAVKALEPRAADAAVQAPAAPDLEGLFEGLAAHQAPILEILRATLTRQDMLNEAMIEVF